jgi:hypothetical protein
MTVDADRPTSKRTRVWRIQVGPGNSLLGACVVAGVVGLDHEHVGDATDLTISEISVGVKAEGVAPEDILSVSGVLFEFVHDARPGDLVVSSHPPSKTIYFGEIAGDYAYEEPAPVPGIQHVRAVTWWGSMLRTADVSSSELNRSPVFARINDSIPWVERATAARDRGDRVTPPPSGRARSTSGTTRRAPTAARPKVQETPSSVCTVCGLRKPAAILHDGVCADCE